MENIERQKWADLLEVINQLEIKGQMNVFLMYRIIGFIQGEISRIDELKKPNKEGG